MIDVKVAFEGLKGEKTKGLKATLKFAKEHDMCMTEAQIQGANTCKFQPEMLLGLFQAGN